MASSQPKLFIPTDWTRVERNHSSSQSLCNDPTCRQRPTRFEKPTRDSEDEAEYSTASTTANPNAGNTTTSTATTNNATSLPTVTSSSTENYQSITGTVVVLLPDPDCEWFQGYFFGSNKVTTGQVDYVTAGTEIENAKTLKQEQQQQPQQQQQYGLLAQQVVVDECLQCSMGGYRELTIQLTEFTETRPVRSTPYQFLNIAWTGADMMRLRTMKEYINSNHNTIRMDAEKVWTGSEAYECIEKIFASLIQHLRSDSSDPESVKELMPQAAVVTGQMRVCIRAQINNDIQ